MSAIGSGSIFQRKKKESRNQVEQYLLQLFRPLGWLLGYLKNRLKFVLPLREKSKANTCPYFISYYTFSLLGSEPNHTFDFRFSIFGSLAWWEHGTILLCSLCYSPPHTPTSTLQLRLLNDFKFEWKALLEIVIWCPYSILSNSVISPCDKSFHHLCIFLLHSFLSDA